MTEKQYETLVSEMADENETVARMTEMLSPIQDGEGYSEIVSDEHTFIIPHDPVSARLIKNFLFTNKDRQYCWAGIREDFIGAQRTFCKIGNTIYNCATLVKSPIISRDIGMVRTTALFSINSGYWYNLYTSGNAKILQHNLFGEEVASLIFHLLVNDTMSPEMERNLKSLLFIIQVLVDESSDGTIGTKCKEMVDNLGYNIGRYIYTNIAKLSEVHISELSSITKSLSKDAPMFLYEHLLINDDDIVHSYISQMSREHHCSETSIVLSVFNRNPIDRIFEDLAEDFKCEATQHLMLKEAY